MSFNGSGTFVINSTGQPVVTGTVISSSTFNALTADLATGLTSVITKDGQTTTTAKIPFTFGISAAASSNFFAGTVAAPGIYLTPDTGTGFYRIAANNNGYSVNGTKLLDLSSALFAVTGAGTFSTTLAVTGATTLSGALTYGGVTLSNAVTGTGNMVLATSPTLTTPNIGAATGSSLNIGSGALTAGATGVTTLTASATVSAKNEGSASVLSGITLTNASNLFGSNWQFDTSGNTEFWGYDDGGLSWNRVLELGKAGGAAITGALSATGNVTLSASSPVLQIGPTSPAGNGNGRITFPVSNSNYNWVISSNAIATPGSFEITPSTVAGGTTFTTPTITVTPSLLAVTGALSATTNANSAQQITVANGDAGNAAQATFRALNGTYALYSGLLGTGYATSGLFVANRAFTYTTAAAGFATITASQPQYFSVDAGTAAAMTLDASGNLLVGTTGLVGPSLINTDFDGASEGGIGIRNTNTGDTGSFAVFADSTGTVIGTISQNSASSVAYNTTSDYRAKDLFGEFTGSGAVIDSLKVYDGLMKGASIRRPMFVAHEAQAVVPYAVTGSKDAVNDKGDPVYQSMDHQILVPLLVAEVQSLRSRISLLEATPR